MNMSTVIKKELPIEVKNNDHTNQAVAHWVNPGIVYSRSEDDPANEETPSST